MNLFTYGTLMDPAVWQRVAREPGICRPAVLEGYEARRLRNAGFPGLVEVPGSTVKGLIYRGVSDTAMTRLDEYEDDFYIRIEVTVTTDDGARLQAQTYLMHPDCRGMVMDEIWQPPPPGVSDPSRT